MTEISKEARELLAAEFLAGGFHPERTALAEILLGKWKDHYPKWKPDGHTMAALRAIDKALGARTVTQADREAAAPLLPHDCRAAVREGQHDDNEYVQAFARHREQSLSTPPSVREAPPDCADCGQPYGEHRRPLAGDFFWCPGSKIRTYSPAALSPSPSREMKMLVDREWLRRRIEEDPDLEVEARPGPSQEDEEMVERGCLEATARVEAAKTYPGAAYSDHRMGFITGYRAAVRAFRLLDLAEGKGR